VQVGLRARPDVTAGVSIHRDDRRGPVLPAGGEGPEGRADQLADLPKGLLGNGSDDTSRSNKLGISVVADSKCSFIICFFR
jgi:hypothetical protein